MSSPKHQFVLYEVVDKNKEYIYLAFSGKYDSLEEFLEKTQEIIENNPRSDNGTIHTKYGRINSITTRKIKPQSPNAYIHFCTGRYGLIGFGRHVVFDQNYALRKYELELRPHTLRAVKLMFV